MAEDSLGEGVGKLSEEGGSTPTFPHPLPKLHPLLFRDFRVYRIPVLELFRRGLFLKQGTLQSGNVPSEKSILEFFAQRLFQFPKKRSRLNTVQAALLPSGKACSRDSIKSKVLGGEGGGLEGGGEPFSRRVPLPPPIFNPYLPLLNDNASGMNSLASKR